MQANFAMKRVTYKLLLLTALCAVPRVWAQQYMVGSTFQSGSTNISKANWTGFTNKCPPVTRYFLQEQFHETRSVSVPNADGSVNWQANFGYDGTTIYDPATSATTLTNVSGSLSFTGEYASATGSADSSNGWTIVITDTEGDPPVTNYAPVLSDGVALDFENAFPNMGLWVNDVSGWDNATTMETKSENQDDVTYDLVAGDLGPGDGPTGHAETKITYSQEYTTSELLQSFAIGTNWQSGLGGASFGIFDGQAGVGMSGSRTRFLVNVPARQQFSIPYILHVSLNGVGTNDLPGAAICATNYYITNYIAGIGFGSPMYYPSGKGLLLRPPYASVNNGCSDLYYGGSVDVSLVGWICLPDGKDKGGAPPCPLCTVCGGMPQWWVSEPYINLWVGDKPVDYVTSLGEKIAFTLTYKERDTRPQLINGRRPYLPINGWNNNWYSYVHFVGVTTTNQDGSTVSDFSQWTATLYEPNGGESSYDYTGTPNATSGDQLLPLDGVAGDVDAYGFRLVHPDGSQDIYANVTSPYPANYDEVVPIMEDTEDMAKERHLALKWKEWGIDYAGSDYEAISPQGVGNCTPVFGSWESPRTNSYIQNPLWTNVMHSVTNWASVRITANPSADALLTEHIDAQGHAIHLNYGGSTLQSVVDYDNNTTTFGYDTNGYIASVNMPYGRTATFTYAANTNAQLLSVTDAQGMTSSFSYDSRSGLLDSITTPYGTTGFGHFETNAASSTKPLRGLTRAIQISNPDGTGEMYAFYASATNGAPTNFPSAELPAANNLDNGLQGDESAMYLRNSYYWGPQQFAALSVKSPAGLDALQHSDFLLGRMRHWKLSSDYITVSGALSMSQDPSPDGVHAGQKTWYGGGYVTDTDEKLHHAYQLMPDGTTTEEDFNYAGALLSEIMASYTYQNGSEVQRQLLGNSYTAVQYSEIVAGNPVTWYGNWLIGQSGPGFSTTIGSPDQIAFADTRPYPVTGSYPHYSAMQIEDATGAQTWAYFNPRGQLTGLRLPAGLNVTNYYGPDGFLAKSIALDIQATSLYSFSSGLLAARLDPNGLLTHYTWDKLDRLIGTAYPDGTSEQNLYTKLDLTDHKDRLGYWTHAQFDSRRRQTSFTDRNGNTTGYGYCACGGLASITDPQNTTTTLDRNLVGWVNAVTFANGDCRAFGRDQLGRATNIVDSSGLNLDLAYNIQGLVTNAACAQGTVFTATYDATDRPLTVGNGDGNWVTNYYDGAERLTDQFFGSGIQRHNTYSGSLRVYSTDGLGQQRFYGHDAAGRLIAMADQSGYYTNGFAYAPGGQLDALADGNGHVTSWVHDVYGREIAKLNGNQVVVETNAYDADGRLIAHWTPAKGLTHYYRDGNGNPLMVRFSDGTAITAQYDALNRLTALSDASGASTFSYVNFGAFQSALATETGPWPADTVTHAYNHQLPSALTLTQLGHGNWTEAFYYDPLSRLRAVTSPAGLFAYDYAGAGRQIQSLTLPGNAIIRDTWGAAGQMLGTTLNANSTTLDGYNYGYDANGNRLSVTRANGSLVNYGYDDVNQLVSAVGLEPGGGTPRANENFGYGYDQAGNLLGRTNNTLIQAFGSDNANVLVNVSQNNNLLTFAGSLTNVPTALSVNGQVAAVYSDLTFAIPAGVVLNNGLNTFTTVVTSAGRTMTNRMSRNLPASQNLSYDLNGNLISDGLLGYDYDCANELVRATATNQWKVEYTYDGLGRRRVRQESEWQGGQWLTAGGVRYVYDGMRVLQERNLLNVPTVTYTRGLDLSGTMEGAGGVGGLLARTDQNGSAYYHADGNGNVTMLVNGSGAVLAKYLYDSFGNPLGMWGPLAAANTYRFSSKEMDPRTGQYYYGYRYYAPNLQRWLNQDPIGERGGINLYQFVGNDPINFVDPYGLLGLSDFNPALLANGQAWWQLGLNTGIVSEVEPKPFDPLDTAALENDGPLEDDPLGYALLGGAAGLLDDAAGAGVKATTCPKAVIGRTKDLKSLKPGERSLLGKLSPDLGSPKANWLRNSGVLRQEMDRGLPIRDASIGDNAGAFLNAERNLLQSHGWTFDWTTGYWKPPVK